jgi:AsmA protein
MHRQDPHKPQLPTVAPEPSAPPRTALGPLSPLSRFRAGLRDWWRSEWMRGPWGRTLKIGGSVAGAVLILVVAVNLLISAGWIEARIAARIKEQTGRDLAVNGSSLLLFTPGPHIVISDVTITDPEAQSRAADLSVAKIKIDLNFADLFSSRIDAERIVLVRPVLTVRLDADGRPVRWSGADRPAKRVRFAKAAMGEAAPRTKRDVRLQDMRVENGTVVIVYDDDAGNKRRIEHIDARLSLPTITAPLIGGGTFEWKGQAVDFSFEVATPADLRAKRPAKLQLAVDTAAIAARFDGSLATAPHFSGEGELSAKANSIPSVLAWMRETPDVSSALGDGELAGDLSWTEGEVSLSNARFALEHASGAGQAVMSLKRPRPHLRAALALDHLDLNPFIESAKQNAGAAPDRAASPLKRKARKPAPAKDWFSDEPAPEVERIIAPPPPGLREADAPAEAAPPGMPRQAKAASPAAFDADINLNVRKSRVGHLDIGPSSLGVTLREGVINASLGGMELYGGRASGTLMVDGSKPVPTFDGAFQLDGVQARPFLTDAAQFQMIAGVTKLNLSISGEGEDPDAIKTSLRGNGSFVISEGEIAGIDVTAFIRALGEGSFDLRQGPDAKTAFSDLGGSFTISDGIAETQNLKMTSPLLRVTAEGTVDIARGNIDVLANPEVIAGPEGRGGANDFAGLTVPVRIEGPLEDPRIQPQIGSVFTNPESASNAVNKIGQALQKKFKGRPVGEAIGRFLGGVQIGGNGPGPRSRPQTLGPPEADSGQGDAEDPIDSELEEILR